MREVQIDSSMVKPTTSKRFWNDRLEPLRDFFRSGRRHELEPVTIVIIEDEWVLYDGNHRVALTAEFGGFIAGIIYEIGEQAVIKGQPYLISEATFYHAESSRKLAEENGINSFEVLIALGFL